MNAEDKITKAKIEIMGEQPFFSYLLLQSKITKQNDMPMPTMGVDAKGNIYYDKAFVEGLPQDELQGCLIHEIMHQCLLHLVRVNSRDKTIWNIATDTVINAILVKNKFTLPKGSIIPDYKDVVEIYGTKIVDCSNKSAEEVYDELISNKDLTKKVKESYEGMDVHIFGSGLPEDGEGDEEGNGKKQTVNGKPLTSKEKKQVEQKFKQMMAEATTNARNRGNLPSGMDRILENLLEPKICWKALLNKYVVSTFSSDTSWNRPHKKSISSGCYLPNVVRETVEVTVAVDVSGSISNKEYTEFMSEMVGIAKSFRQVNMNVLFWDTTVGAEVEIRGGDLDKLKRQNVSGYGGTDFSCVRKYLYKKNKRPKVLICFTDGYFNKVSTEDIPDSTMIWAITSNGSDRIAKDTGVGIVIKMEQNENN